MVRLAWLMRESAAVPFMWRQRAERIQLLPQHTVCLCLQHYPGYVYQGGWQNCDSVARALALVRVKHKVALVNESRQ